MLSIETCFGKFSIALFKKGKLTAHFANSEATKQAEELIPAIEKLLKDNGTELSELSAIAVCIGPGSFTGLRIGMAAAKGLALGLNIPLIGVSSLEAAIFKHKRAVKLDASRGQAYFQQDSNSEPQLIDSEGPFDEPASAIEVGEVALQKPISNEAVTPLYIRKPDAKQPHEVILSRIHAACFEKAWNPNAFEGLDYILHEEKGFVAYKIVVDECEIKTIAVLPEFRRQKIAAGLIQKLLGFTNVKTFFLEVEESNAAARKLYENAGFAEFGRRKDYYGKGRDALLMRFET